MGYIIEFREKFTFLNSLFADIFNEILEEFSFGDEYNTSSMSNDSSYISDQSATAQSQYSLIPPGYYKTDDPLLSSSNNNISYILPETKPLVSSTSLGSPVGGLPAVDPTQIYCTMEPAPETFVYESASVKSPITTPVASPMRQQHQRQLLPQQPHILNNVMILKESPKQTLGVQSANVSNTIQLQPATSFPQILTIRNGDTIQTVSGESKPILLNSVMYTTASTATTMANSGVQNIHLIDGATILTTHVPVMLEKSLNKNKVQINRVGPKKVSVRSGIHTIERKN